MQSLNFFQLDEPAPLVEYLRQQQWIENHEHVLRITKAGEGNMNFVARIQTDQRSIIFKQSRPWVEKYPQIEAPVERIESEVAFYQAIQSNDILKAGMPALLGVDLKGRSALFEDLGEVEDYASMYDGELAPANEIQSLIDWLSHLHRTSFPGDLKPKLQNLSMRQLNHAHLFDIPLQKDNGLSLDEITSGLDEVASSLKNDEAYCKAIHQLGVRYLSDGDTLLHGDFYPGSWVRTNDGPRIIDPEFGFFGPAEYDFGVCKAHLIMAEYAQETVGEILAVYQPAAGFSYELANQFAGMEIMRRLIGVAQLPMTRSLALKKDLLEKSKRLVLDPSGF